MKQMKTTRILYLAGKFTAKPSQRPLQSHDAPPQQGAVTKPNEEQKKTAELDFARGLVKSWFFMPAPNAEERKSCHVARDDYFSCKDAHPDDDTACAKEESEVRRLLPCIVGKP